MKHPIRVLIADDHYMARIGISTPINGARDMTVVAEARNGEQAIALYREHEPDVALLDYQMPDKTGIEVAQAIRAEFPEARLLMLSVFDGEEDIFRAEQAGISGYLTKSAEREQLLQAIRSLHAGDKVFPPDLAAKLKARQEREPLSERELAILSRIVEGDANKQIAAALHMSEGLIKLHVSEILRKLDAPDRTRAATLAIERGIVRLSE